MIEYSEYTGLVDILDKSENDSYSQLMKKEDKVLDTINNVVKYYKDEDTKEYEFVNKPIIEIFLSFFNTFIDIYTELLNMKKDSNIITIFTKEDRMIYIGILLIVISLFLFYIKISK
jgi:hypothetical protein